MIDRDQRRRLHRRRVLVRRSHRRKLESVGNLLRHRRAQLAASVLQQEIHCFRGDVLGGIDEVSLILALGGIDDDYRPPCPQRREHFIDGTVLERGHWLSQFGQLTE